MNFLKLVLAAVFGLALGAALSHTPAIKAQSNGIAVTVYGGKMTTFTEGSNTRLHSNERRSGCRILLYREQ